MKSCFGTMYPVSTKLQFNKEIKGKVFKMRINSVGPGHREPHLDSDMGEWEDCQECPEYRSCLDFSNAQLAMQAVIQGA